MFVTDNMITMQSQKQTRNAWQSHSVVHTQWRFYGGGGCMPSVETCSNLMTFLMHRPNAAEQLNTIVVYIVL